MSLLPALTLVCLVHALPLPGSASRPRRAPARGGGELNARPLRLYPYEASCIDRHPLGCIAAKMQIDLVGLDELAFRTPQLRMHARPAILGWQCHHAGAYRIEFDVAHDRVHIPFGLYQAGLEPPLPQDSAAPVPDVEGLHIQLAAETHRRKHCASLIRRDQQMHVVVHQHKRMHPHSKALGNL